MAEPMIRMPSSGGGIIRYFDEYKSKIQFSPTLVIVFIAAVILLEVYLHSLA